MSNCHPDKKHRAKGLCSSCYSKLIYEINPELQIKARERTKNWAKNNQERANKNDANKNLIKKYGITLSEYNILFENQFGVCKICERPETVKAVPTRDNARVQRLAVDHCHVTGKIRGLLCFKCNTAISFIDNNKELISKVLFYIGVKNE